MNLATSYLGLNLSSPLIVGASPFCDRIDTACAVQDAGAAAVVMRSLYEEQWPAQARGPDARQSPAAATADYQLSPAQYLRQLEYLKEALAIPVIASLNGCRRGEWIDYARQFQDAGADAIELNCYQMVTAANVASDQIETEMLELLGAVVATVRIPVAVKLSPFHTSLTQLAVALELAGAAGLVLFNRFYQRDVDTDERELVPRLRLSDSGDLLLRLRWLATLSPQLRGSLAASGGVHRASDIVKALLTGADVTQLVSVLLQHGPRVIVTLRAGLEHWMREHGYTTIEQFRGTLDSRPRPDPAAFERASYVEALQSWTL